MATRKVDLDRDTIFGGVIYLKGTHELDEGLADAIERFGSEAPVNVMGQSPSEASAIGFSSSSSPSEEDEGETSENHLVQVVGTRVAGALQAAGYSDIETIRALTDDQLREIPGVGDATIERLRKS